MKHHECIVIEKNKTMIKKKSLLMIDLQNDFCTGGSLAVPFGEEVIPLANQLQACFELVIATQDWHPQDHASFASRHKGRQIGEVILLSDVSQILWPDHCVQQTKGAAFHPLLNTQKIKKIFHKGMNKTVDSYSAFFDNAHHHSTGLHDYLHAEHVSDIYLMGLATDYCVKYSALDAIHLGFNVFVIQDACRGVALQSDDIDLAFDEMKKAGARLITCSDLFSKML